MDRNPTMLKGDPLQWLRDNSPEDTIFPPLQFPALEEEEVFFEIDDHTIRLWDLDPSEEVVGGLWCPGCHECMPGSYDPPIPTRGYTRRG